MGSDGLSDWGLIAEVFAGKGEVGEGGKWKAGFAFGVARRTMKGMASCPPPRVSGPAGSCPRRASRGLPAAHRAVDAVKVQPMPDDGLGKSIVFPRGLHEHPEAFGVDDAEARRRQQHQGKGPGKAQEKAGALQEPFVRDEAVDVVDGAVHRRQRFLLLHEDTADFGETDGEKGIVRPIRPGGGQRQKAAVDQACKPTVREHERLCQAKIDIQRSAGIGADPHHRQRRHVEDAGGADDQCPHQLMAVKMQKIDSWSVQSSTGTGQRPPAGSMQLPPQRLLFRQIAFLLQGLGVQPPPPFQQVAAGEGQAVAGQGRITADGRHFFRRALADLKKPALTHLRALSNMPPMLRCRMIRTMMMKTKVPNRT